MNTYKKSRKFYLPTIKDEEPKKNPQLRHKYGITEDFMLSGLVEYTC
ncbi:hypothetical protein HMPREF0776_2474 [Staphylococcus aureus subsp. aureus USA300_TCH959]|jgi:hypothetical protein|nr:hypothetical protein HMPREF0776_2474 [Staphylococcus aureus subsp. aureus USA300_TCH959]